MKNIIIVYTCKKELVDKALETITSNISPTEVKKYEDDDFGVRDKNGKLVWDFLKTGEGETKITITGSSETVRQINMAILKGSLEKGGKKIPSYAKEIPGLDKDEVKVFHITREGEVKEIGVEETGFGIEEMDLMIEEVNQKTEEMYYELKYGD